MKRRAPPGQLMLRLFGEPVPVPEVVAAQRRRRLSPGRNAPSHDLVMTPAALAQQIVDAFTPRGVLLDPCRGEGAFYNALLRHSNEVRWCEIAEGRDFLTSAERVDWIISNPPWSRFRPFLQHAMRLAPNVVFLATVTHFVTRARLRDIERAGFGIVCILPLQQPPPPWPSSGFQLAAVHLRRGAPSLLGRPAYVQEVQGRKQA